MTSVKSLATQGAGALQVVLAGTATLRPATEQRRLRRYTTQPARTVRLRRSAAFDIGL